MHVYLCNTMVKEHLLFHILVVASRDERIGFLVGVRETPVFSERGWLLTFTVLMLAHTWWDGPMVRVVALFLRSFRATQNPTCAKLVVWTPTQGSERATAKGKELVEEVEK